MVTYSPPIINGKKGKLKWIIFLHFFIWLLFHEFNGKSYHQQNTSKENNRKKTYQEFRLNWMNKIYWISREFIYRWDAKWKTLRKWKNLIEDIETWPRLLHYLKFCIHQNHLGIKKIWRKKYEKFEKKIKEYCCMCEA